MTMTAAYKENYKLIDWSVPIKTPDRPKEVRSARSDIACPYIIRDHIRPTFNHADGKTYESATSFKRGVKEAGKRQGRDLEIVGDDPAFLTPKPREIAADPTIKADIKAAYDKVVGV